MFLQFDDSKLVGGLLTQKEKDAIIRMLRLGDGLITMEIAVTIIAQRRKAEGLVK